jgi:acyl carrier protein
MEVEEEVASHPDVVACAAFSASHDVLQEVVGIVIAPKSGRPRLDLPSLHAYLGDRLAAPKWPQVLVFLEGGLPKSHTNKLLRVKLGQRFCLPELNDSMSSVERTFEGQCPSQGTDLDVPIPVHPVLVSAEKTEMQLRNKLITDEADPDHTKNLWVVHNAKRHGSLVCYVCNIPLVEVIETARDVLDAYAIPTHFVTVPGANSSFPEPQIMDALTTILQRSCTSERPVDPVMESIQDLFVQILKLDYIPAPDANFFHLGGSSMLASQLASKIRKQFGVPCSGADIFHHVDGDSLAKIVRKRSASNKRANSDDTTATSDTTNFADDGSDSDGGRSVSDHGAPFPAKRLPIYCTWWAALVQLVPMFVVVSFALVCCFLLIFNVQKLIIVPFDVNSFPSFRSQGISFSLHLCCEPWTWYPTNAICGPSSSPT